MRYEDGFGFDFGWSAPGTRFDKRKELTDVLHSLACAATSHGFGTAHAVTVAPGATASDLAQVCDVLRRKLRIRSTPAATLTRRAHKKGYRPPDTVDDPFIRMLTDRFARLRFLDGTTYEEFVYLSDRNHNSVLVERRAPVGGKPTGTLLAAFVAVAAESGDAAPDGRLSRSIREWMDSPTEMSSPTTSGHW